MSSAPGPRVTYVPDLGPERFLPVRKAGWSGGRVIAAFVVALATVSCAEFDSGESIEQLEVDIAVLSQELAEIQAELEVGEIDARYIELANELVGAVEPLRTTFNALVDKCDGTPDDCFELGTSIPIFEAEGSFTDVENAVAQVGYAETVLERAESAITACLERPYCMPPITAPPTRPSTSRTTTTVESSWRDRDPSDETDTRDTSNQSDVAYQMPSSRILFLTCDRNINNCYVERENGSREYTSPYAASGTSPNAAATTRFYDNYGLCYNVAVFDAPIPYSPYVRASRC